MTVSPASGAATVPEILLASASRQGEAPALLAPGRPPLSYAALAAQTRRLAAELRGLGFSPESRIAVVLPNGPEMAAAFLAVSACAGCAPLNPAYTRQDFDFYFSDLRAAALLAADSAPAPALEAARAAGIPVLTLRPLARAGEFTLTGSEPSAAPVWPGPAHPALFLHTSGTTSRPKLVPLTAANLAASAAHIAATLALTPADRCLNIMPLFHIHGLMAAVLASIHAGGSVVCTDGVYANRFFEWLDEFSPTWYTAVPAMHQGILASAPRHAASIQRARLRFIRSSSASLPPTVMAELERTFNAPVIEAYGMTEAAHQMASNPLPPRARKPGSVGLAAGPEIAIMDEHATLLPAGATGEVVIRGPNVTPGYESNPAANAAAFANGWFRTGDQGWMDPEGYLFLTGRLKELINRGGEKIAPREVDEALLAHPDVRQALAFAVPHVQLGEEVAAAVELKPGAAAGPAELRAWAAARLPAFKVPRLIRIVDAIPKGPTGKLQRIGLAAKLGIEPLDDARLGPYVPPRNELEEKIAAVWRELLPGARAGVEDRFEALGGDSLLAVKMLAAVSAATGVDIPYERFLERGTIASLAECAAQAGNEPLITLRAGDPARPPLICVPGHDGSLLGLARMAAALPAGQAVWAFEFGRMERTDSIAELAAACVQALRRRLPAGPYRLAGVCFGGCIAHEIACRLAAAGGTVELLCLIDSLNPAWRRQASPGALLAARARQLGHKFAYHFRAVRTMPAGEAARYLYGRVLDFFHNHGEHLAVRLGGRAAPVRHRRMMTAHVPGVWQGDLLLIRLPGRQLDAPALGWTGAVQGRICIASLPFSPHSSLEGDSAGRVAAALAPHL